MITIVKYTDTESPRCLWPRTIVSPTHSSPCCATSMEGVGHPHFDGQNQFQYKRCRICGFTVRSLQSRVLDEALVAQLRIFFTKNVVKEYFE